MKLLLYSHYFAPSIGGVETIVLSLARGLAGRRDSNGTQAFEITLVTEIPPDSYNDGLLPFRVIRQPSVGELWKLVQASDIVHIAGPALLPLVFGRLARKPLVVEHHGFQTICPNGQLLIEPAGTPCPGHFMAGRHFECLRCNGTQGWLASRKLWLLTFVRRFLCKGVAANITPTQWLGELLALPKSETIFHGLDSRTEASSVPQGAEKPVITFMGRLVTTKGVRLLLEAARILREKNREFELVIIGDGPERSALQQFTLDAQLTDQITFTGRLSGPELEIALLRSLAVVVPSLGGEVFGLVVAENMLRGLPVVASDIGAFVEVIGDAGLIFETGNADDLAAKLGQLLDDPVRARSLGERARNRAIEKCSLMQMLDAHAAVYQQILKEGTR
jgi:glycosyltransferase involved in cell wall biosynthesis